jgi:hypothetical protein
MFIGRTARPSGRLDGPMRARTVAPPNSKCQEDGNLLRRRLTEDHCARTILVHYGWTNLLIFDPALIEAFLS